MDQEIEPNHQPKYVEELSRREG